LRETIRSLMQKHLVKHRGSAERAGGQILTATTKAFLQLFG